MTPTPQEVHEFEQAIASKLASRPQLKIVDKEEWTWEPDCHKCNDQVVVSAGPYCDCPAGKQSKQLWSEKQANVEAACRRRLAKARQKLDTAGGFLVPERYKFYSPESLVQKYGRKTYDKKAEAWLLLKDFASGKLEKPGLLLTGDFGTGKTAAALCAMRNRIRRTGEPSLLIRYADFIGAVQQTYSKNSGGEATRRELILAAQTAPLLMLDDFGEVSLGSNAASNDKQTIILEVLDYRVQHGLATLIVTNLTQAWLMAQFNGAIVGRLMELCQLVTMGGRNLREKEAIGWS